MRILWSLLRGLDFDEPVLEEVADLGNLVRSNGKPVIGDATTRAQGIGKHRQAESAIQVPSAYDDLFQAQQLRQSMNINEISRRCSTEEREQFHGSEVGE